MLSLAPSSRRQVAWNLVANAKKLSVFRSITRSSARRPVSATQTASSPRTTAARYNHTHPRGLFTTTAARRAAQEPKMAADDDYMAFLNKANEDPSAGSGSGSAAAQSSQGHKGKELKAADQDAEIPQPLLAATKEAFYLSDADEPFVPVSLAWAKGEGLPNEEEIASLVEHWDPSNAEVEIMDPVDWDRSGQYKEIVEAVRKAGKGNDVRVYRIVKDRSRVEYFVVTRQGDGEGARLVGVKALAIES